MTFVNVHDCLRQNGSFRILPSGHDRFIKIKMTMTNKHSLVCTKVLLLTVLFILIYPLDYVQILYQLF